MNRRPLLITLEGGEGSGKSTQVELFRPWFEKHYGPAISTREPGGVPVSEELREFILESGYHLDPLTQLFLFQAARVEFVKNLVIPTIKGEESVICDRYGDSTIAYQGYGEGIPLDQIAMLNNIAYQGHPPDLTFLLDISAEKGLGRAAQRGELNRIDRKPLEFHQAVNEGFRQIAKKDFLRCVTIPADRKEEIVQANIQEKFLERYP